MKVLLVNPPRFNELIGNNPALIEEERGHNTPLGLLMLAGYLRDKSAHDVAVLDAQVEELGWDSLRDRIAQFAPDVVGVTAMTLTLIDVMKTVDVAKAAAPKCRIVLGGPHAHLFPDESVALPGVDYVVIGEGEDTLLELVDRLDDTAALRSVPGLVLRAEGEIVKTGQRPPVEDLDALPHPARDLTPYRRYSSLLSAGEVVTTMFTSRGCPFKCSFCDRPHLGKRFRARSADNVVDEIDGCVRLGIREFLIYDDTFTCHRGRVIAICDEILRRGLDIRFDIRARVDTVDGAMLDRLKAAGCRGIHYGVEAGTAKVLERLNKGIDLEKAKEVFDLTRKRGIPTLAYFMIGNPGETREDIEETFAWMRRLKPDYVHLTVLTPFPGTALYAEALDRGLIDHDVWREFAENPHPDFTLPHWPEHFTREELNALLVKGYRKFYLRPGYMLRRVLKLRSWTELKKKAHAGLGVFRMKPGR